jgi:hypothetical protein
MHQEREFLFCLTVGLVGASLNITLDPTTRNASETVHYLNVQVMCGDGLSKKIKGCKMLVQRWNYGGRPHCWHWNVSTTTHSYRQILASSRANSAQMNET